MIVSTMEHYLHLSNSVSNRQLEEPVNTCQWKFPKRASRLVEGTSHHIETSNAFTIINSGSASCDQITEKFRNAIQ